MAWYYRRGRKFGPFRITVSKSGISSSVGFGGLRITNSTRGTYLSASPGGGLYYRERIGGPVRPADAVPSFSPDTPMQEVASEHVSNMADHAAILDRLNANEKRGEWLLWLAATLAVIATFTLSIAGFGLGALTFAVCCAIREHLVGRSPVEFDYHSDQEDSRRQDVLKDALGALMQCERIWRINAFGGTDDWKRNGGAGTLVRRSGASVGRGTAKSFRANIEVPCLTAGKETLYFLPDMILVKQGKCFGSLSYTSIQAEHTTTRFNEVECVPRDTQTLGTTWRFVNKSGGPDRRFNNNQQIPVVLYGEIAVRSDSGFRLALMTSSAKAAEVFVAGICRMQSLPSFQMTYLQAEESTV